MSSQTSTATPASASRVRTLAVTAARWLIPLALIAWLLQSGKLDLRTLGVVFTDPLLIALNIGVWFTCSITMGGLRWRLLLRGLSIEIPIARALWLQAGALFANTAVPGNVAGDVLKNVRIAQTEPSLTGARIATCVLVERVLGLSGLILIAACSVTLRFSALYARVPVLVVMVYLLALGVLCAVGVATIAGRWAEKSQFDTSAPTVGIVAKIQKIVIEVGRALLAYSRAWSNLVIGLLLSVSMHSIFAVLFVILAGRVAPSSLSVLDITALFPIGMLTTVLPLAPGGIGVGHAAFDKLFALFGARGGADVCNVFLVAQLGLNLLGFVSYLSEGKRAPSATSPAA
jgi:uncharacterized protein (TIRG00374 family)